MFGDSARCELNINYDSTALQTDCEPHMAQIIIRMILLPPDTIEEFHSAGQFVDSHNRRDDRGHSFTVSE